VLWGNRAAADELDDYVRQQMRNGRFPGVAVVVFGRLEIASDLLSTDAVRVKAGARVMVEHWGGENPLEARVRRIEPAGFMKISALGVEEQRVNVVLDFVAPSASGQAALGDGYRVEDCGFACSRAAREDDAAWHMAVTAVARFHDVLSIGRGLRYSEHFGEHTWGRLKT
jgi:hypothetical protein